MTRKGRLSLGGNALRDSHRHNIRSGMGLVSPNRGVGNKRRVSFGGNLSSYNNNNNNNNNSNAINILNNSNNGNGNGNDDSFSTTGSSSMMEPKKDRRTMLEEWRAQVRAKEIGNGSLISGDGLQKQKQQQQQQEKENRMDQIVPSVSKQLVPSLPLPPSTEGTTAVERFRMRRLQRERRALGIEDTNTTTSTSTSTTNTSKIPTAPMTTSERSLASTASMTEVNSCATVETIETKSMICFDDDPVPTPLPPLPPSNDVSSNSGSISSGSRRISSIATPTFNRRMTLTGGPRRRANKGRMSLIPPLIPVPVNDSVDVNETTTSTTLGTIEASPTNNSSFENNSNNTDTNNVSNNTNNTSIDHLEVSTNNGYINEPGLHSRIVLMEKRIHQLEKEKMTLSMSKAPLEARLRQKEDQWSKEQTKYEQEIASLMNASKDTNDRFKSMEMEYEEVQEENRKLKFEARRQNYIDATEKAAAGSNDVWSRQLQNDRDVMEYKDKLRAAEDEIKALRLEKVSIESEVNATQMELSALVREFDDLQEEYEDLLNKKDANADAEIQLEELAKEHTATTAQLNATSGELASLKSQSKFDMEQKEQEWSDERDRLMFDMSVLQNRAATNNDQDTSNSDVEDEAVLKARIEERDRRIAQLESDVLKGEQIRRDMHNRIQELRGNIRVFVRARPFLPGDNGETVPSIDVLPDGESLCIDGQNAKTHDFKFDKVFAPSSGQEAVFDEVSEFVQSALDGYHVCLFSYGQTGSGKTHTMQGSGSGAMRGIIPRAVEQILNQIQRMKAQKWNFKVTTSFLEIYNEELRDLLGSMSGEKKAKGDKVKLTIRREKNGKSYVSNLTKIDIDTEDIEEGMHGLKSVMASAARSRSVACTKMNSVSSRSHSVFMLHLSGMNEENGTMVEGALNLCDLAGSERLDRSGAGSNAQRLKETQSINKSLSCLGDVFTSLSNGSPHIPFRNSKLTYLLQDCLSGDGKALMFVNLSPTLTSSNESLCSLRFAQRVNQVELGKATKHVQYRSGSR